MTPTPTQAPAPAKATDKPRKTPRQLLTDLRQDALNAREAAEYPDDEAWAEAQTHAYTTALNVLEREGYE
jgi:hypothetical protein